MKTLRRTLVALLALAVLLVAGGALYARHWLSQPLPIGAEPAVIDVQPGQSLTAVTRDLAARGLVRHPRLLALYGRAIGVDSLMHAGEFSIALGTTPRGLLQAFVNGAVVQHSVTVVEGWTFRELRKALAKEDALVHATRGMTDAEVMGKLGEEGRHPEGLFFPDTYLFGKGTRDVDLLRQARDRMRKELAAVWSGRAQNLPLKDEYEALVLASIVERETGNADERPRIAGVFIERMRRGMKLQTDPTVIYGLGEQFDGNLRRADLERDTDYNTYTREGLPPTPIALPGLGSLRAVARPEERGELFFVATGTGDGRHTFSKTLAEHEHAVRQYVVRYRQQSSK